MRIIHEIHGEVMVSFPASPYTRKHGEPPHYKGARVDGIVTADDGEALHIEGDLNSVRQMCTDILDQLEDIEDEFKEQAKLEADTFKRCEHCGDYYDPVNPEHADGQGFHCLMDGTVLMGSHAIYITDPPQEDTWPEQVSHLKKGDKFVIDGPIGYPEQGTFEALDNPIQKLKNWYVRVKRPEPPKTPRLTEALNRAAHHAFEALAGPLRESVAKSKSGAFISFGFPMADFIKKAREHLAALLDDADTVTDDLVRSAIVTELHSWRDVARYENEAIQFNIAAPKHQIPPKD